MRRRPLAGQPFGLFGQMTGDAGIEPTLDLGSEVKDFDSHGKTSYKSPERAAMGWRVQVTPCNGVEMYIAYPADRFQYMSFNIS